MKKNTHNEKPIRPTPETLSSQPEDEDDLMDTGVLSEASKSKGGKKDISAAYRLSTQDLIVCSILAVMGGFISGLIPFSLLVKTWYPFVGGTQLISGHHILWSVLAYGITRKKSAILLTSLFQGFLVFLLGASWGILEVGIQMYEGGSVLVGFYIIEKLGEGDTTLGWGLASGIGNFTQVPFFWILTGKIYILHWTLFVMAMMFAFISGFVMAGLLSKKLVEQIKKANIV